MSDDYNQKEVQYDNDLRQLWNQFKEYTLSLYGPFTLGQLAEIVQTLASWEQTFRSFIPHAEALKTAGYPRFSQGLKQALNTYYTIAQGYRQMYHSQIMTEQYVSGIQHNMAQQNVNFQAQMANQAQQHARFQAQMTDQANRRRQMANDKRQMADRSHKDFMSTMFGHCLGCGTPIGVSNAFCINCAYNR